MEDDGGGGKMTEYEKQRLSRIRENKARLEALGLPGLSTSIRADVSKEAQGKTARKKKTKADDEEEYQPSDGDEEEGDEGSVESTHSSDEEILSPSSSRRKGKRRSSSKGSNESKLSEVSCLKRGGKGGDFIDDDVTLAQAIALSLGESVESENVGAKIQKKIGQIRKRTSTAREESSLKKITKKQNKSRIQLSEDEVIAFFFFFDEVGKGYITAYDIEKMAIAHDFTWTDGEIAKMVRCFDSDGDRKLTLEDFRSIVSQCHMLQDPE